MSNASLQTYVYSLVESTLLEIEATTHRPFSLVRRKEKIKQTFDMETFKQLPYNKKRTYLESTLENIGEGSSRAVYALSDQFVIKFGFNKAGLSQNHAESTVCSADPTREFFTKIKEMDPNYEWLVVERAAPMTFEKFEELTGISFVNFMSGLIGTFDEYADSRHREMSDILLERSKFFKKLINIITQCKYMYGDLASMYSWGIAHGKAVIVDSGFTESVYHMHYKKESSSRRPRYLDEAEFPHGFDVNKLKQLPSFKEKVNYAEKFFRELGVGSSRVVLAIDTKTAFKLARNDKGIAQNKVEIAVSQKNYATVAKVLDYDPSGLWLEMERAKPLTPSDFRELTGFSWKEFKTAIENWYIFHMESQSGNLSQQISQKNSVEKTNWFQNITQMIKDFDMPFGDIERIESWGIVNRNDRLVPVLIDYGLTEQIWQQFYRK